MRLEDFRLHAKMGKLFYGLGGPGRPREVRESDLVNYLNRECSVTWEAMGKVLKEIQNFVVDSLKEPETSLQDMRDEAIINFNPFKNFFVYSNQLSKSLIVYYKNHNNILPVCPLAQFDRKVIHNTLVHLDPDYHRTLVTTLQQHINPKDPGRVSAQDVIDVCINVTQPETNMQRIVITSEPHPAVVEGLNIPALHIIPFKHTEVTICDLNPLLHEFLLRVSDHEYMCANLWTNFIGIKTAALIYLKGMGNDGKSAFVKMLGNLAGSVCNYDWSERFNYFNMFGKSLIVMNENKMPNILQHTVLKAITGGDFVQIEAKGKNAFSAEVRGQLIIVANDDLKTLGTPDESRRLRYFQVTPHNISSDRIMGPDEYLKEISSTPNQFLNYMRQCYEKLKTSKGLVSTPPHHVETIRALRDPVSACIFEKIINDLVYIGKQYEFDKEGECDVFPIVQVVESIDKKNKFALQNFEALIAADYGVIKRMNKYVGLKKKEKI